MCNGSHKTYDSKFKFKVALAAIKGEKTTEEICEEFNVVTSQVYAWKNQLEESGDIVFVDKRKAKNQNCNNEKKLQKKITIVTAERDFLARVLNQ